MTSAASRTGAAICRQLLNSNASVLGLDTTSLQEELGFGKEGSSFLFIEYEAQAAPSGTDVAHTAQQHFKSERIDWLINVIDEKHDPDGISQPMGQILTVMEGKRTGLVLNVLGGSVEKGASQQTMLVRRNLRADPYELLEENQEL